MLSTMTETVPSLRQLVVSGEVCPPELVARWATPGRVMLNVYGPTEATVNATAFVCRPGHPITIGRPLDGYETLVLDADMRPLPPGTTGELFIGGPGVARISADRPGS
jgi:non-ribosomal peptide synthetase component F